MNKFFSLHFYMFSLFFLIVSCSSQNNLLNQDYVSKGENLYVNNCINCHGVNLQGQKGWEGKLDEDGHRLAPPLNGTGHTWHHPPELLSQIIKYGLISIDPAYDGKMIGNKNLSDQDIEFILEYIKSFWPKEILNNYEDGF